LTRQDNGPQAAQNVPMLPLRLCLPFVALLLAACATPPGPDTPKAEVLRAWGAPTAVYALGPAGERLEYATGPYGRTTWMIDLNAAGRVTQARQVLNEAEFALVQSDTTLTRERLLRWIGTPGERHGVRGGGQTWSWRYPTNDCLWFQASIAPDGRVLGASYGIDPSCDGPNDRE
jgi:hypothetical protein